MNTQDENFDSMFQAMIESLKLAGIEVSYSYEDPPENDGRFSRLYGFQIKDDRPIHICFRQEKLGDKALPIICKGVDENNVVKMTYKKVI